MSYLLAPCRAAVLLLAFLLSASLSLADPATMQLLSLGRMNDAIQLLLNRDDAESLHLLSRAYYATEHFDEAVKSGERAVALRPGDSNFHLWLARAYGMKAAGANPLLAANLARKAKAEFERSVQLDPSNTDARSDLSEYYVEAPVFMGGGLDKARDQARQMTKLDVAASHAVLAQIATREKQFGEAEGQYQQAIKTAKHPAGYWLQLASFYRSQGRLDDMQKAVTEAIAEPGKSAATYYDAANLLYQAGRDFPSAIQYLNSYLASGQLVEDAPAFRAHFLLGQIYEKTGHPQAAMSEYQASLALASGFDRARKALDHLA